MMKLLFLVFTVIVFSFFCLVKVKKKIVFFMQFSMALTHNETLGGAEAEEEETLTRNDGWVRSTRVKVNTNARN